jgi:hydrogenase nickel incorporation protein HypA/HybF
MHEVAIVQALIEQVEQEVRQSGQTGRVLRLELVIGRLSGVHPDSIRFAVEVLGPGTLVEHAQVDIVQPPAYCSCRACGAHHPIDELTLLCPQCGSPEVAIEGGTELLLQSIELEDAKER